MIPQRRVIRNQSLGSILLLAPVIGLVHYAVSLAQPCTNEAPCYDYSGMLFIPAFLFFIGGGILYLTSLIESLSRCIEMKTWRWLAAILPFGPVGIYVFGVFGPQGAVPETHDWFDPTQYRKPRSHDQATSPW
jgi:hypothetical protein